MQRPRFSIIIPTRNRASLLPCAMRSALGQTFDDFELVVVNNASTDHTVHAFGEFTDSRLRIVNSSQSRLMHDNWAFALTHARGEYVLYLCDDDAWHPRLLEVVDRAIESSQADVICWRSLTHFSNDWFEPQRRGLISCGPPFSDRMFDIDTVAMLDAAFDMRITITDIVPRMLNSAVSLDLISRLAAERIRLFRPCNPDYSCFMAMALRARRMIYLDAPLLVSGATPHSVGASASHRGETARRFLNDLLAHEPGLYLPPSPRTPSVWVGQTYMQCSREIPALRDREANWIHLYGIAGLDVERYANAVDVSDWRQELDALLHGPLSVHRKAIEQFIADRRSIETDQFLVPTPIQSVLGCGPRLCADVFDRELEARTIDDVATALDRWYPDQTMSLGAIWDQLATRSGKRLCVTFGLGLNGRAVLRMPPPKSHPLHGRLRSHDDRSDLQPRDALRMDGFEALDPRKHFVLLTPNENRAIIERLKQKGFCLVSDIATLESVAAGGAQRAPVTSAAAGSPSGYT